MEERRRPHGHRPLGRPVRGRLDAAGHVAYFNLREPALGCYHSGDIVDAPEGACEFIDMDIEAMLAGGVRYVVMCLNSFTQQPYCDLPECFAGWMAREQPQSGEVFEARTVQDKIDLASDTTVSIPVIIDLEERRVVWADVALRSPGWINNVHANRDNIARLARAIVGLDRPNLYDLFLMHAEARGEPAARDRGRRRVLAPRGRDAVRHRQDPERVPRLRVGAADAHEPRSPNPTSPSTPAGPGPAATSWPSSTPSRSSSTRRTARRSATSPPGTATSAAAFSLGRMSWIKPNFLWMMYRSGWGTKEGQEVTLAVRLRRDAFDEILRLAVHSTFVPEVYETDEAWKRAVAGSDVRLQWDPDHGPSGNPVERRAIQLGLRGDVLARYAREWLLGVEDISDFVAEQRANAEAPYRPAGHAEGGGLPGRRPRGRCTVGPLELLKGGEPSNVLGSGDDRLLSSGQDDLYMHVVEVRVIRVALVVACHPRRQAPHPDLLPLGDRRRRTPLTR